MLLAVDLGVRTGLALFNHEGRLERYLSRNLGNRGKLRKAAYSLTRDWPEPTHLFAEGDRGLAEIWFRVFWRAEHHLVAAEDWRPALLTPSQQRSGGKAKDTALNLAAATVRWSGLAAPTSLTHDVAEAILLGLWGAHLLGWLERLPEEIR